jgi:outer membrane murein-binding lipoprotein Lpp
MSKFETSSASDEPPPSGPSRDLIVVVQSPEAQPAAEPGSSTADRFFPSRFHFAAVAALAVVVAVAGALFFEDRQQAQAVAERANETESLAHTLKSLKVRLDAIDTAVSSADLADLRQSIGEIKSTVVSTREISGALAQLSQRVDHEASAMSAALSTRIDKLEQKVAAPPPALTQAAQSKQTPARPKFDNVSMDRTSSIERPRPLLRGYVVLDARDDVALVGGRYGEREVRQGDFLPGAGRVERIELRGEGWVVMTSEGLIASADFPRY